MLCINRALAAKNFATQRRRPYGRPISFNRVPRVNQRSVCYGGSVEQYVALYKGCARNRASISSSASVLLDVVETQGENLDDDL